LAQCRRCAGRSAYGIISLLPVEVILQVGSGAGFAMVFALLIAAVGKWWLGNCAAGSIETDFGGGLSDLVGSGRSA
jgi:PiT family inorganic phosphate transporter